MNWMITNIFPNDISKLGSGNQYTFNPENWIYCPSGTISATCTWMTQTIPIRVGGDVSIYSTGACKLTIAYGTVLEFNSGTRLAIGYSGAASTTGALSATGATFRGSSASSGFWKGLLFDNYTGESMVSGCLISDAGNTNTAAITIRNNLTTITGCMIQNCLAKGISIINGKHANISANNISTCGSYPLSVDANGVHYVMGNNVMTGNAIDRIELIAAVVSANCTWRNHGIPYLLTGTVNIYSETSPRLTIMPGVLVLIQNSDYIAVGYTASGANSGALDATGVTFSRSDSGAVPYGLIFQPYMDDANTILTNCIIEYCRYSTQSTAAYCNSSSPRFVGCTFRNNPGHGIGGGANSHFSVENCRFENNGGYPIKTTAEAFSYVSGSGNSFAGNNPDRILISGSVISSNTIWNNPGIPVEVNSDISIYGASYPILMINSGLHLVFQTGCDLFVGYSSSTSNRGGLQANGAQFSALNGSTGGWNGITFQPYLQTESYLRSCIIEHGGANACVYLNNSPLAEIFDCVIRYGTVGIMLSGANSTPNIWRNTIVANGTGIVCSGSANPFIGGSLGNANSISANTSNGVSNTTAAITVNAEFNWWGDPAGPLGPLGDGVSSYVDYDPWRETEIGDAPGLFALLSPDNGAVLNTLSPLLDWEDAVDPTIGDVVSYTLEINISPSFTVGGWTFSGIPSSLYNVPIGLLADDIRFYWRVTAYDTQGQNTFCSQAYLYFDIAVPEAPAAFALHTPMQDAALPFTSNLLSWQSAIDPDLGDQVTYNVYTDLTAGFETAFVQNTTATEIYSGFCAPGTIYYWQVVASDTQGHSTYSDIYRFYVLPDALPRTPDWLHAEVLGSNLNLSWEAIPGADSYLIYSADEPYGTFDYLGTAVEAVYSDTGGANQSRKFYQVKAVDSY